MSSLKLYGSTSGYVEVAPEATAQNNSITIPNTTGTIAVKDASGNLGIGTDNPGAPLDVVTNSSAEGIRVRGRSSDSIGSLYFYNHTSATSYGLVQGRSTDFRLGSESNTPVIFNVNSSEVARFNTSGNLAFPSGNGIDFSATGEGSGTMTSELLDDYEEGTWTPSASGNATHLIQVGHYTKIGRLVTVHFVIQINAIGTGSPKQIYGLPFAPDTGNAAGSCDYFEGTANQLITLVPYVQDNVSYLQMRTLTAASNGMSNANILQNNTRIDATVAYMTTS